jgi:hypothetical protein
VGLSGAGGHGAIDLARPAARWPTALRPPGYGAAQQLLGVTNDDVRAHALHGLTRRLALIGVLLVSVVS